MRRNIVLIDFESVQPDSIEALNYEHFHVLLFCGANQSKIPFEIAATLQKLGPRAEYIKITGVGPNALDFHIAYYIGRLAAEDPSTFFHVVSRDKGFDPLIQHLKSKKVFAVRSESIADIPIVKNGEKKPPTERAEAFIVKLKEPKVTRPRTEKTMASAIKTHFQPNVDKAEAAQILKAMIATGFISVQAGKIVYAQSAT
ncbi:MAG TPA: PIN domain-containing protein [Candidatus Competibacteraceae bacterium]|nr:MAG: hypothetical protein EKK71_01910 [Candidatus Competibacteraceae bacterium]HOB60511.1 PIN domain-containing protein [Candidatus Competibacteraceae bacterium]HQA24633.1 PIN domain-containing protein [Candidatus Competibacteraceae bacterium]HQD54882.1 PIN domain-containing protein [Candidatus Competibacteraceae bacterium]